MGNVVNMYLNVSIDFFLVPILGWDDLGTILIFANSAPVQSEFHDLVKVTWSAAERASHNATMVLMFHVQITIIFLLFMFVQLLKKIIQLKY